MPLCKTTRTDRQKHEVQASLHHLKLITSKLQYTTEFSLMQCKTSHMMYRQFQLEYYSFNVCACVLVT